MPPRFSTFDQAIDYSINALKYEGTDADAGRWQGIPTEGKPDLVTREILNLQFEVPMERGEWHTDGQEEYIRRLAHEIRPSLPWADEHFAERVGGVPWNPDPSHVRWPWWHGQDSETKDGGKFTHTYSERFWPKYADEHQGAPPHEREPILGIRFRYGDLEDVLAMLEETSYTRQAYLPIFFPEDTGAVHGGRIPCSLGYHFLLRNKKLHMWYEIRSCDAVRHFRDDVYLAARLQAWVIETLFERELRSDREQVWVDVDPGTLFFSAHSFHVHMGDYHHLTHHDF